MGLKQKYTEVEIVRMVNDRLGVNTYKKVRKREYIEARSVVFQLFRESEGMTLMRSAKVYGMNHATVINSLNGFKMNCYYTPKLRKVYNEVFDILNGEGRRLRVDLSVPV